MAVSVVNPTEFELFITCVDKVGPMLKIWGQCDRLSSMFVEQLLKMSHNTFEVNPTPLQFKKLQIGTLCCAKYKDGVYYRAKITNLRNLVSGSIEVKFVDYGNIETIQLENIRLLENVAVGLATMKPQATDFILANVIHINQQWDEKALAFVHQDIAYIELKCTVVGAINNFRFITVSFHDNDLADYLVQKGIAIKIPLASQENIIRNAQIPRMMNPPISNMHAQVQMPQNQTMHIPVHQPPPVYQQVPLQQMSPIATPELCSYRTLPLEPNSEHMVYVSYVEDGPFLFSIQLQSMEESLTKLMIEINQISNLLPLTESPLPGHPCMARCLEDESLCRAVVINLVEDKCKTYYVDFGNTDILPFSNIFQIPFKYMLPKVMSMRFTLHELKNVNVTNEMKCQFKEYVTNKLLKLKVLRLESSPVIHYCELYDENNQNVINILYGSSNQYKTIQINKGQKLNVIVSFIEGCKKFFVQLKESSETLANLMRTLASSCETSAPLQKINIGMACVAFYSGDNQWYRAQIVSVADNAITVKYVDYGNEDTVSYNCLKKIDPSYVKILPAQAIECCLYGYQNMSFNTEIENVFESLTLECEFSMRVISKQSNDSTVLVDLFDASGNNVAALLIEKLASQKSELLSPGPLPANKVTRSLSLLSNENYSKSETITDSRASPIRDRNRDPRSPKQEKYSWRNSDNDKPFQKTENEKSWKNSGDRRPVDDRRPSKSFGDDKKSWRNIDQNTENSSPTNRENNRTQTHSQNGWNGDSPTNKRSQRSERSFSRNSRDGDSYENKNKFRSDKFESNKFRSDKRQSPQNDFGGKKSNWNNSGSESEKSWSGSVGNRSGKSNGTKKEFNKDFSKPPRRQNDFQNKNEYAPKSLNFAKSKPELPPQDLVPLEEPFKYPEMNPGATETVSISWFYNPENFFVQLKASQIEFKDLMTEIQSAYSGRPPVSATIPLGASVVAEFQEDAILYRATVLENKYPKYKVQYVDFGNMSLVDCRKIWQVEKKFMNLPVQAIKCGISNLKPANDTWVVADQIDHIFNKDLFTATFDGCDEAKYFIQVFDNDVDIRQQLIDSGLAIDASTAIQMVDEPVDLSVLLGQNISVKISYVQDFNVFYVHLEKEKASTVIDAVNTFMKDIQIESLQQFTENQLIIGTTCLVKIDESTWKRGVIMDNSDLAALKIAYPDFGGNGIYSSDQLYIIPPELCIYWYQAFECSLHNLTENVSKLVTDEDFKQKYEEQNLIIYVDEIVDGRLIVTPYDLTGTKLELIEPDEGAFPTIEAICPLPVFNSSLSVWVSHVNNVASIYLQRNADGDKIAELLHNLHEHYEAHGETKETIDDGELCVAKSEDGNWYRGRVEQIADDSVKILYIDYGNTENVPKTNLKTLDLTLFGVHEYALHASLNLQEASDELTAKLTELVTEQLLTANIMYGDAGWLVELINNNEVNVNQILIDSKLAVAYGETFPIDTITEESPQSVIQSDAEEARAQITITHIDSPSEFYVQLVANEESIFALQADLQAKQAALPDLEGADIGVLCAAKYTVDEHWYRAEVLDADAEITTVRFIDYGNTDVISNNQSSIKTLPSDLLSIDKYARKCSLNVKPIKDDEWSQEAAEMFESSVDADVILADIVYQDEKNKTFVELYVDGHNVAEQLLDNNLAVAIDRNIEDNIANNTGFVSHLNSVSEFWIQLESSVPDLEMIVDRLASADTFPDLLDLSPGILCAANFPDDEMWYRARILSNTVAGIEVLFVDYGNSSTAMKLKVLPEDLIQMPPLAQKFALNKPANIDIDGWSERANDKFREISADGATIFAIRKLAAGETSTVELYVDEQNILDQLVELCDLNSTRAAPLTPIGQRQQCKVHLTHAESPDHFWIQLHSDNEKIDEMMESVAAAGTFEKLTDFDADTTCVALYEPSSLWYRAKIYEVTGESEYEVLLVDYGNTLKTKDLRALPTNIEQVPPLATLCTLELPDGVAEWTNCAVANFNEIAANKNADFRIEFIDNEVPSKVKLYLNGRNIADEICIEAPQQPFGNSTTVSLTSDEVTMLAVNTVLPEATLNDDSDIAENEIDTTLKNNDDDDDDDDDNEGVNNTTFQSCNDETPTELLLLDTTNTSENAADSVEESCLIANQEHNIFTNEEFSDEQYDNETTQLPGDGPLTHEKINITDALALSDDTNTLRDVANNTIETLTNDSETNENVRDTNNILLKNTNILDAEILNNDEFSISEPYKNITDDIDTHENFENLLQQDTLKFETITNENDFDSKNEANIEPKIFDKSLSYSCPVSKSKTTAENLIEDTSVNTKEIECLSSPVCSRPTTPHCDKIVPGSICRGDLEMPVEEEELQDLPIHIYTEITKICSRPATPHNDKIVPGSISRGEEKPVSVMTRPATPQSEKIVPGSITRGDLSEPPAEENIVKSIPEIVMEEMERPATPKIPLEDKILPGSLNQEVDSTDE